MTVTLFLHQSVVMQNQVGELLPQYVSKIILDAQQLNVSAEYLLKSLLSSLLSSSQSYFPAMFGCTCVESINNLAG